MLSDDKPLELTKRIVVAPGMKLRMVAIGDSITYGSHSSDMNGYRGRLQDNLAGSNQLFIGSVRTGTMSNNQHEGRSGYTINQIAVQELSLSQRPNVVFLHAGTNDMVHDPPGNPWSSAPTRLGALIDKIVDACPDAVVLVAKIIPANDAAINGRINNYNAALPAMVAARANANKKVRLVDMTAFPLASLDDMLHPNDAGYQVMANIWLKGLQDADAQGLITAPIGADPPVVGGKICSMAPYWIPDDKVASGTGSGGNGIFAKNWISAGQVAGGVSFWNATDIRLVDLDGDGKSTHNTTILCT